MPQTLNISANDRFLREQLTQYGKIIVPEPEVSLWGYDGLFQTTSADLPLGLQAVQSYRINYIGEATDFNEQVTEIPLATFGVSGTQIGAKFAILGSKWTFMELETARTAAASGMGPKINIVGSYRYALRRGLRSWMHKRVLFGDPGTNFQGILNPGDKRITVRVVDKDDGPFAGYDWNDAKTKLILDDNERIEAAQRIYDYFSGLASQIRDETYLTVGGSMDCITSEPVNFLLNTRFTDGSGQGTAKQVLMGTNLGNAQVRNFNIVNEAKGKNFIKLSGFPQVSMDDPGTDSTSRVEGVKVAGHIVRDTDQLMLIYSGAANTMRRRYFPITMMPPERIQLEWTQIGLCGTSEVEFPQPDYVQLIIFRTESESA